MPEIKKQPDATAMDFSDEEGGEPAEEADESDAVAALSQNFDQLAACAREEIGRNPGFRGVTITFQWARSGAAEKVEPSEPALRGGELANCLAGAMGKIRLPRRGGAPREVSYPILIKR